MEPATNTATGISPSVLCL